MLMSGRLGSRDATRDAMDKHIVIGAAIGMFGFAALDTLGLIAPFVTTEAESDLATAMVYGGGIFVGMIGGEIVRRIRARH